MRRLLLLALASILGSVGIVLAIPAAANADPCLGTWDIVMGGFVINGGQDSAYFANYDQRVGYNTWDPNGGVRELDRLIWKHRNECPTDHIKLVGHSEGAGLVHNWVTTHQDFPNANAILLADPKRAGGDTGVGMAVWGQPWFPGYPLTGVDDWFGSFPVLQVCRWDDVVCRTDAGWGGYIAGHHVWYNFDANAYGDWETGTRME